MTHWTEDNELVERYVLNKLSPGQRTGLDAHLKECPPCRATVEEERILVEGVRSYARDQLKTRLRGNVPRTGEPGVPWPHILSAAAVVLIVVGLGYFIEWRKETPPLLEEVVVSREAEEETPKTDSKTPKARDRDEESLGAGSRTLTQPSTPPSAGITSEKKERRTDPLPVPAEDEAGLAAAAASQFDSVGPLWIEGMVVRRSTEKFESLAKEGEGRRSMDKAAAQELVIPDDQIVRLISVSQQPLTRLPVDQGFRQKNERIPASVEVTNDVLKLTMYSDTLDVRGEKVRVEPLTDDSLIIVIDGIQVAYKIPGGWGRGKNVLKLQE